MHCYKAVHFYVQNTSIKDIWIPGVYAIVLGALGIWGSMSNELLQYGQGRSTHLVYYVVILLVAAVMLVVRKHRYFCED